MRFEFATAARIIFGPDSASELRSAVASFGKRPLLVCGASGAERSRALLPESAVFAVPGEPTIQLVREGVQHARQSGCDALVGFGGGSAIDAAKAIAALITNGGDPLDYAEVIGAGKPLAAVAAPFIAVPTTAGTGSEVTRNAVLGSPEHSVKVSLRSPSMLACIALVDPKLTYELPPDITAASGLDALTQVLEPFVSVRANPLADGFCVEGMRRAAAALRRAYHNPADRAARDDMSLVSLLSGLSLANAGLGAVHGFAAPIGGMFKAPHGAVCAALLPHATGVNIEALKRRAPDSDALRRYDMAARLLLDRPHAAGPDLPEWLHTLTRELNIPGLATYGIQSGDVAALAAKAREASSMKANPIALTDAELREIVERAL